MSYTSAPDQQIFIDGIAGIVESNSTIFPETGSPLLTKVLRNQPAIESAPETALPPYCFVRRSETGPREIRKAGRDSRTARGGTLWQYEYYVIIVVREITKAEAQKNLNKLAALIRQSLDNDITLGGLCRRHVTYEIPYLLKQDKPDYQALNIVVRPEVFTNNVV